MTNYRNYVKFCKNNNIDTNETILNIYEGNQDFEVSDYRFIHKDSIDSILKDELSSDTYILGCFSSWFISDITGLNTDIIDKAQESESFELLGELMLRDIDNVVSSYVSSDGYGQHFGHYDGNEYEVDDYYIFRIN